MLQTGADAPRINSPEAVPPGRAHRALGFVGGSRIARLLFVLVAAGLAVWGFASHSHQLSKDLAAVGWTRTLLCTPMMFGGLFLGMLSWRRLLAGLGSPQPVTIAGRIYFIGQLGKYLPGSLWPVVTQMELAKDHGIPRRRSLVAVIIALMVSVATGVLTAAVTLPIVLGGKLPLLWLLPAVVPVLLIFMYPPVLWSILRWVPKLNLADSLGEPITERMMLGAIGWSLLGWLVYGLHIAILMTAAGHSNFGRTLLVSAGGYGLAWCVGLIAFVLPAGAGARDLALVFALSSVTHSSIALAVAVVSRAVTTVADLGWAGLAIVSSRRVASR